MGVSRRNFLRTLGIGAAAGVGAAAGLGPATAKAATIPGHFDLLQLNELLLAEPSRTRHHLDKTILLNSNENAYGPPPKVVAAMNQSLTLANRYPDRDYEAFVEAVATHHHVNETQVLAGCGSTEILRMAACAFTSKSRRLVMASPTFESIRYYAQAGGAEVMMASLTHDYAHDLDAMWQRGGVDAGLFYICNPNNPTGSLTPRKSIEAFLARMPATATLLVDEAYHHFAGGAPDAAQGPNGAKAPAYRSLLEGAAPHDDRLIVARTFSKIYALAGIRAGYAVATAKTIDRLRPFQLFDNLNIVAARGGVAGLRDVAGEERAIARNARDRVEFFAQARKRKLNPIPSYTNFVMMETGTPVRQLISYFRAQGILIGRPFPPMDTFARISLGTPPEMQAFWSAWDSMPRNA